MFILGDLVGGGVVAMPVAFAQTGFVVGMLFMVIICAIFVTTGWLLADTWEIMRERWPEYRKHCRKPFSEMALRSMSKTSEIVTKVTVYSTLFGATVVYILLSSKIIQKFMANFDLNFNFCLLLIIVSMSILPITFLKSPADFWWAILIAVLCTVITIVMIFVGISLDFHDCYHEAYYSDISIDAILSLGIFLFAFNGHQVFPTVQNDMRNPPDFKKSVLVGFVFVGLLYMPLSAYAFLVYGNSMSNSVIDSVQTTWIRYVADLSIAVHCILAIIITVNPVNLQLEDTFNVPHKFCFKRVVVRTGLLLAALFVGLSLPNFGSVMNLFGSTTVPCTCVILPTLFSIYIKAATYDKNKDMWIKPTFREVLQKTPKAQLSALILINVITVICSMIATALSVKEILGVRFTPPCYALPFLTHKNRAQLDADVLNCCGMFRNISKFNFQCGAPS
ncbi:transmembrane amino acid transporter [Loa loa]|uniref:Transmembrane amino acid transporter n=1 Tax=Loa loa TaxID=7209 RepID=A0A1S0U8E4_LOALO|nr:transmembrane amino acid transporter [Loa loa]EFO26845.2 transmembrane amino acid transporter [Loa loa]